MKVGGVLIDFDVEKFLSDKGLHKVKPSGYNVMACCPFHNEREPSFGINIENGQWNCFGCGAKGSLSKLVKELDGFDTEYDATEYLINMYGRYAVDPDEAFELEFDEPERNDYHIDDAFLRDFRFRHPYWENKRGIELKWIRAFELGYDKSKGAVTIPWRDEKSRLVSVKMRKVTGKQFWYAPSMPNRIKASIVWGLDKVLMSKKKLVAVTEGEIDAISVWQTGISCAVAMGGNQVTAAQTDKLIKWLKTDHEIVWFGDNDGGGQLLKQKLDEKLSGHFKLSAVDWSLIDRPVKDANDLVTDEIIRLLENRKTLELPLFSFYQ